MQKYFTSIFNYGLSQYNVYAHKKMKLNEIKQSEKRMNNIHAERSEAGNFFEKNLKKGPKKGFFTKKCWEVHKK